MSYAADLGFTTPTEDLCVASARAEETSRTELFQRPTRVQPSRGFGDFPLSREPSSASAGQIRMYGIASNTFAPYLVMEDWIIDHYERMQVYAPWFDEHTAWYANGLEYKDLYAIYNCEQFSCEGANQEHQEMYDQAMQAAADPDLPDWILKDSQGNPLYIPWGCESGTCPQFAADLGNPAFRTLWIEQMTTALQGGNYRGLFVDDVQLDLNRAVSDGNTCNLASEACNWTVEIDAADWAGFVADFTEEIRAAFPNCEIAHNSVWFHAQPGDAYLERQVGAADYIGLERGVNDAAMQPGWGMFGIENFLYFNDYLHERGRKVVHFIHITSLADEEEFDPDNPVFTALSPPLQQLEYGLAGWLLISDGHDLFGSDKFSTPDDWWHGLDTDLGHALGERYQDANGLIRRDFEHGIVLLNGPGAWSVTVTLPETFYTLEGDPVDEVVLGSRVGKILLYEPPAIDSLVTP